MSCRVSLRSAYLWKGGKGLEDVLEGDDDFLSHSSGKCITSLIAEQDDARGTVGLGNVAHDELHVLNDR